MDAPEDYRSFEALQREIWGPALTEVITASMARIVSKIGGIAAGAFDKEGEMLGVVFGLTGFVDRRPVHWSHMLAVRESVRDAGIGKKLKHYQRETLLARGVEEVRWTYDPLVAKNAHLNFNSLGTEVIEYVPDMYGPGNDSELFRGLGTDRFIVVWHIASERVKNLLRGARSFDHLPFSKSPLAVGRLSETDRNSSPRKMQIIHEPNLRIEIPRDIHALRAVSSDAAAHWRMATREAFQYYLPNGFAVSGFYRDESTGRCFYCLRLKDLSRNNHG